MNRAQRKYGRIPRLDGQGIITRRNKNVAEILEVWPPRSRRKPESTQSRSCQVAPEQRSAGQLTGEESDLLSQRHQLKGSAYRSAPPGLPPRSRHHYKSSSTEPHIQYPTYSPVLPDLKTTVAQQCSSFLPPSPAPRIIKQLEQIHHLMCACARSTTDNSSQYAQPRDVSGAGWQSVENTDELDYLVRSEAKDEETLTKYHSVPKDLYISEVPRIKQIAVKFTKYMKDNIELRRIDERVVCVEYDVFDNELDKTGPVQKLLAFFTIKQLDGEKEADVITVLPSTIKSKFNISAADLHKLSQKEIEIIDGKVVENQPYLQELRKILRRRENPKVVKNTPNLQALYEMGKRNLLDFDSSIDIGLSKDELVEMQNLILKNCKSSVHGIRRKTVKNDSELYESRIASAISRSLVTELMKESKETIKFTK